MWITVWSNENTSPWTHTHCSVVELRTVFKHTYDITLILHVWPKASQWPLFKTGFQLFKCETTQEVRTSSAVFVVTNWIFEETSGRFHAGFFAIKHYILDRKSGYLQTRLWRQHWQFVTRPQDKFQTTFGNRILYFIRTSGRLLSCLQQQNNDILMRSQDISSLVLATNQMFLKRPQDDFQLWFW